MSGLAIHGLLSTLLVRLSRLLKDRFEPSEPFVFIVICSRVLNG